MPKKRARTSKDEAKQRRVPRLESREFAASERKMWEEYAQAAKAKVPKVALDAWARKYNVKLLGKNRMRMVKVCKGEGRAAPTSSQPSISKKCEHCHIKKFSRWYRVGKQNVAMLSCELFDCEYRKEAKEWICMYDCVAGTRIK